MMRLLKRLLPRSLKSQLREHIRDESRSALDANTILASLYTEPLYVRRGAWKTWDRQSPHGPGAGLPLPPPQLRMGHSPHDPTYLTDGQDSANFIRKTLKREGVSLRPGSSILDWGCASGRTLRHFLPEAEAGEAWGVDQHGPSISWCKDNLSPPFRFLTGTAYPHLPFEDAKFTLVYAGSVFTYILHLMDMWLMEFRRILAPGGYALFTIHDEHTRQCLSENQEQRRVVDPPGIEQFSGRLEHELGFLYSGGDWRHVVSFLRSDWVRREWGQYLEVVSIEPRSQAYQSTVVLRKS